MFGGQLEIQSIQSVCCEWQDPYIVVTLHDGQYDAGGAHRGEAVKTQVKDNAGGEYVPFGDEFLVAKPGAHLLVPFTSATGLLKLIESGREHGQHSR